MAPEVEALRTLQREEAAELVGAESVALLAEQVLAVMQLESVQAVVVLMVELVEMEALELY
jgi:hypothetical protein